MISKNAIIKLIGIITKRNINISMEDKETTMINIEMRVSLDADIMRMISHIE